MSLQPGYTQKGTGEVAESTIGSAAIPQPLTAHAELCPFVFATHRRPPKISFDIHCAVAHHDPRSLWRASFFF